MQRSSLLYIHIIIIHFKLGTVLLKFEIEILVYVKKIIKHKIRCESQMGFLYFNKRNKIPLRHNEHTTLL